MYTTNPGAADSYEIKGASQIGNTVDNGSERIFKGVYIFDPFETIWTKGH